MAKKKTPKKYTLAQRLRDPAKRASIPTSQLPAKYRAARAMRLKNQAPIYNPMTPLSGRDLRKSVNDLVDMDTRPQMDALTRQGANLQTQGAALSSRTSNVYRDIAQREAANLDQMRALRTRVAGNLQGIANGNVQQAINAGQDARQSLTQMAPGLEGSGADRLSAEQQALQGRAAEQGAQFRSVGELQGSNYENLANAIAAVQQVRGGEAQAQLATRLANQLTENEAKQADIRAQRGPLSTKYLMDLRDKEFTNELARKEFGLKAETAAADAVAAGAKARAQASTAAAKSNDTYLTKYGVSRAQFLKLPAAERQRLIRAAKGSPSSGKADNQFLLKVGLTRKQFLALPTAERQRLLKASTKKGRSSSGTDKTGNYKGWGPVEKTLSLINSGPTVALDPNDSSKGTRPASTAETTQLLRRKGVPEWQIQAAISIRHHGFIIPSVMKTIPPGVTVPGRYRHRPAPKKRRPSGASKFSGATGSGRV